MKVDFSAVLMNIKRDKPLQIQVEPGKASEDGRYIIKEPVTEDMTLGALALSVMQVPEPQEPGHRGSELGPKRSNFALMVRIAQGGVQEITTTERDVILAKIAKYSNDVTFGRADELLNPQPKEVPESKTA